jgi:hypothetical protein
VRTKFLNLSLKTKIRIFESNVKSVLLYGCETWKSTAKTKRSMQVFIYRCLWKILRIRWPKTVTNEELWERTGQKLLDRQIKKRKWSRIGHILRKPSGMTEKGALDWNPQGKRRRRRPKKTWKRTVEEEAGDQGKRWQEVKAVAENKVRWRSFVKAVCCTLE